MADHESFEDRLRSTFEQQRDHIRDRQPEPRSSDRITPIDTRVADHQPPSPQPDTWWRSPRIVTAAAVALFVVLAGAIAWNLDPDPGGDVALNPEATTAPAIGAAGDDGETNSVAPPTAIASPEPDTASQDVTETQAAAASDDEADPLIYAIQPGDTLGAIAQQFNVSIEAILAANPDLNPNVLFVDQELIIEPLGSPAPERPLPTPPATPSPPSESPTAAPEPTRDPTADRIGESLCVINIIAPDTLTVREGPGTDFVPIGELNPDECGFRRVGPDTRFGSGAWTPIQRYEADLATGRVGHVAAKYVATSEGTTSSSTPTPSPEAETVRVQFEIAVDSELQADTELSSTIPPLENFEVFIGDAGLASGTLEPDGSFLFRPDQLPARVRLTGEWIGDPFCWWSGDVNVGRPAALVVEIAALCA